LTDSTPHTLGTIYGGGTVLHRQGIERTRFDANAARCAIRFVNHCNEPGRCHRRCAILGHHLDAAATAFATIANRKHSVTQNILEPRRMQMSPFVFGAQKV
jgi:hypothetical protein